MILHLPPHLPLFKLQRIKKWHVAHRSEHPLEYPLWDVIFIFWVMGRVGWLPAFTLDAPWAYPLCLLAPSLYVSRRMRCSASMALDTFAAALQCATEIAAKPPIAIWGTKQAIHYARDHSVDESLKQMGWLQGAIWSNQQVLKAVTAMKSKRPADFAPLRDLRSFRDLG